MPKAIRRTGTARTGEAEPGTHLPATAYQRTSGSAPADEGSRTDHPDLHTTNRRSQAPRCRPDRRVGARLFGLWRGLSRPGMTYWMIACSVYSYIATFGVTIRICRRQGLPGLPWCAGVPVRCASRTEAVSLVGLIGGHGAGSEREPGRDARMPPGSRTVLRDGRAAGRVPAGPGDLGPGGGRQPEIIEQAGVPAGGRTPVNVAVEPAGAVPGRPGTGECGCPVRRARSCHHAE